MSPHMNKPRVLVTGAGGPAGVAVIRSLHPDACLFAVDIDRCAVGLYLVSDGNRSIVPRGEEASFIDHIMELCRRWRIDVVIPTVDTELLPMAHARLRFEDLGVAIVAGPAAALSTCLDKWQLASAVESTVPCPITHLIDLQFDAAHFPAYPAVAKPRQGSGSRGVQIIDRPEQLAVVPKDSSFIVQEFLPGEELSVDVYVDGTGQPLGAVPRTRWKVDSGVAVAGRTVRNEEAMKLALDTVAAVGLTGPANVQCRRDRDGRLALLEVNPRFPGSLPLTIAAGFDIPALALREAQGIHIEPLGAFREIAVVRHWEDVIIPTTAIPQTVELGASKTRGWSP